MWMTARRRDLYSVRADSRACAAASSAGGIERQCREGGREGLAAWIARARWRVREPWPVPASRMVREGPSVGGEVGSAGGWT